MDCSRGKINPNKCATLKTIILKLHEISMWMFLFTSMNPSAIIQQIGYRLHVTLKCTCTNCWLFTNSPHKFCIIFHLKKTHQLFLIVIWLTHFQRSFMKIDSIDWKMALIVHNQSVVINCTSLYFQFHQRFFLWKLETQ